MVLVFTLSCLGIREEPEGWSMNKGIIPIGASLLREFWSGLGLQFSIFGNPEPKKPWKHAIV